MRVRTFLAVAAVAVASIATAAPAFETPHVSTTSRPPAGVSAIPVAPYFSSLGAATLVPRDVVGNVVIPGGSKVISKLNIDRGMGNYQREVLFETGVPVAKLVHFFSAELVSHKWSILSISKPPNLGMNANSKRLSTEILAKYPSSDGFYWEAAITATGALGGGNTFSLELRQLPDPD